MSGLAGATPFSLPPGWHLGVSKGVELVVLSMGLGFCLTL